MAELLSVLWPDPCVVDWSRGQHSSNSLAYAAIPNWNAPVVIAPRRPRRSTAAAIRGYNTAARGRTRVMAKAAALAASIGATDRFFESVWIDDSSADSNSSIRKYLVEVLGHEVTLSISVGPARAVQKPVIQVVGPDNRTRAFAKVGHNALTRKLVEQEVCNLHHLQARLEPGHGVQVPAVLGAGTWRATHVLVQSALRRGHAPSHEQFMSAMRTISRLDGVHGDALGTSSYLSRLRSRIDRLPETEAASLLRSAIATIDRERPLVTVPFGSWHGDMTPWNITSDVEGVRIWDWEHYAAGVPVGFDLFHYEIQNRVDKDRMTPVDAIDATFRSAPHILTHLDVPGAAAPWTVLLYIVEIATRYVEDGEQEGNTKLGNLAWLEPSLRGQLRQLCGDPG